MKEVVFSQKQRSVITYPFDKELEVNEGTPRSGKTTAGHFRFASFLLETKDQNHLIAAYNQEQAFRLFIDGDGTGLMHIFNGACAIKHDEHGDHLEVHTPKGIKRVYYKGAGKANSVGSITGMSLGSVVFCEINLLHMSFIQEAFRRTMAAHIPYHLADLNPPSPMHPVIKEVFEVRDMRWTHWTMDDNPILTDERKNKLIETLKKSPYLYQRDVEGRRVMPQGVIYSNFDMQKHISRQLQGEVVETYYTVDAGQGDATTAAYNIVTLQRGEDGLYKHHLYRVANYYHSGTESGQVKAMSTYAEEIRAFMKWCFKKWGYHHSDVFVDPAAKSIREELNKIGISNKKADNNSSDRVGANGLKIEVGIERAKSCISEEQFSLLEGSDDYDHYHFLQEVGLYVRDDNGKPVDANNHCMDEFRYSINYFYKKYIKR